MTEADIDNWRQWYSFQTRIVAFICQFINAFYHFVESTLSTGRGIEFVYLSIETESKEAKIFSTPESKYQESGGVFLPRSAEHVILAPITKSVADSHLFKPR